MPDLRLSLAISDYVHIRDVADGRIRPVGIELIVNDLSFEQAACRFGANREFDISEFSLANFCAIVSAHGLVASPFKAAYVAAKHGILGLTKTVALEVAQLGITCNAICPGYVKTPLVEAQIADQAKARGLTPDEVMRDVILAAQPTKEFVAFDQLAGLMLYLVSDLGAFANGAAIRYLDFNDTYVGKIAVHPSDNIAPGLAVAEAERAFSGALSRINVDDLARRVEAGAAGSAEIDFTI